MPSATFYGATLIGLYAVIALEVVHIARRDGTPVPWREVAVNMNSGQIVLWLVRGARVLMYAFVLQHASLGLLDGLPAAATVPIAFLLWDLGFYTSHWAHHRFPLLWDIHVLHHQGEGFNISLAVRNSWLQALTPTPFFLVLAVIGVPLELYLSVGAVHYIIQLYNHNGTVRNSGWLNTFMVTPTHHKVHHARNAPYLDRNFGSSLIIWDRLFGTFAVEDPDNPVVVGIDGAPQTANIFWLNLEPVLTRLGLSADLAIPKVRYDYSERYVFAGSVLHFLLMGGYIIEVGGWSLGQSAAMVALIFIGTVLLGGVADGRRSDLLGWVLFAVLASGLYLVSFSGHSMPIVLALTAVALHGLWGVSMLIVAPIADPAEQEGTQRSAVASVRQ